MTSRLAILVAVLLLLVGLTPNHGWAQELVAEAPVTVGELQVKPTSATAGDRVELSVELTIDAGYHVYGAESTGIPTTLTLVDTPWLEAVELRESPAPHEKEIDPALPVELHHSDAVTLTLVAKVLAEAPVGENAVQVRVDFMACTDEFCLEPEEHFVEGKLTVAGAPTPTAERPAVIAGADRRVSAAPGSEAELEVRFETLDGWYLYDQRHADYFPPAFEWTLPEGVTAGGVEQVTTPEKKKREEWEDQDYYVFKDGLVLRQRFVVAPEVEPGTYTLSAKVTFQACEAMCIQLDETLAIELVVAEGAAVVQPAKPVKPAGGDSAAMMPSAADGDGGGADLTASGISLALIGQAMLWGLLTVLTPCVFPLIPISVSFFTKQEGPALPKALTFAGGIIFTITVIGLIFSASLDAIATSWAFNAAMAAIFLALALSLFGLYDLRMPSFLVDRANAGSQKGGFAGALFMGVTLALTSFSCSMPFLAFMFQGFDQGNQFAAVVGLLVYSATMAAPFFIGAMFPSMLKALPRSGGWLNAVKVTMGFVELALVFKFLRGIFDYYGMVEALPRTLVIAVWIACALGATLYLLGYITLPHDSKVESIGVVRLLFAMFFLSIAGYLLPGLFGKSVGSEIEGFILTKPSELTLATAAGGAPGHEEMHWPMNDWDEALVRAETNKRLLLIDFTGTG